jgi:hypothetical protein
MTDETPPPDPSAGVTKVFAGGIGSITAAFGVVGTVTGGLERVFRNHPKAALALIVFGAVVVAFGIVGPAVTARIPDAALMYGTIALVAAGAWLSWLVVDGASTKERPSVSGSLSATADQVTVKAQVEAGGLKSSEHMLIKVEGERYGDDTVLYVARVGPNSEGKVKAPVETVVPRAAYGELIVSAQLQEKINKKERRMEAVQDCGDETPYWGCVRLLVPAK